MPAGVALRNTCTRSRLYTEQVLEEWKGSSVNLSVSRRYSVTVREAESGSVVITGPNGGHLRTWKCAAHAAKHDTVQNSTEPKLRAIRGRERERE